MPFFWDVRFGSGGRFLFLSCKWKRKPELQAAIVANVALDHVDIGPCNPASLSSILQGSLAAIVGIVVPTLAVFSFGVEKTTAAKE
jgi:hypothetical protein